jgi:hypothetical protein
MIILQTLQDIQNPRMKNGQKESVFAVSSRAEKNINFIQGSLANFYLRSIVCLSFTIYDQSG